MHFAGLLGHVNDPQPPTIAIFLVNYLPSIGSLLGTVGKLAMETLHLIRREIAAGCSCQPLHEMTRLAKQINLEIVSPLSPVWFPVW